MTFFIILAENFVGLSYPGSLVGRALGFNINEGFAWSMNAVTPKHHIAGIRNDLNLIRLEYDF